MQLPQLPADKANHYITGQAIAMGASLMAAVYGAAPLHALQYGVAAAALAGVAKEISDWVLNQRAARAGLPLPHGVELLDAVATAAGGAAGWVTLELLQLLPRVGGA